MCCRRPRTICIQTGAGHGGYGFGGCSSYGGFDGGFAGGYGGGFGGGCGGF